MKFDYVDMSAYSVMNQNSHNLNEIDRYLQKSIKQKDEPEKRLF